MGDNLRRKCLKCGSSPCVDPNIKLYRFPNPGPTNTQRCELWAKFCFPEGAWSSVDFQRKLYSEHRMLCNLHFQISSFTDYAEKKLNRHAVPDAEQERIPTNITTSTTLPYNQSMMDATDYCSAQPGPSCYPSSPIPGPSRKLMDITNIQPYKIITVPEDLVCKIPMDTSKDYVMSQPGPSKVPIKSTEKQHEKTIAVSDKKCSKYLKKICELKNTIKKMKSKNILNVLCENNAVQKLSAHLTPAFALILQGELKNTKRKYKGRRWTSEQKIIALRLYKRSPSCYRLLRRLWCLPAPSTLKNLLAKFQLNVGLNDKIFKSLKTHVESQEPSNNEYILMFDEMAIKKHLWYNNREDRVDGYQDHGEHGRSPQEASHALVFMVSGIRKRVKQPVAFYLSSAYVTADRLAVLIKNVLHKCFEINLTIAATVCDMGGVNRRALNILGASTETPYFNFENNEVVTLFDTPHLLKCFRNMFLKHNLKCYTNITSNNCKGQGIAKWKHIEDFFEVDNNNGNFVFAPNLRKDHLNPNNKQKMRVNLAAQVLSHSVAAGMFARISQGLLPTEATITAEVIADMDRLFDCVNSDTPDLKKGKPYSTNLTNVSPHLKHFAKMKKFFATCEFVGCQSPPPSKQGWIWTLNGIEKLFNNLKKKHAIRALATRRLQQDPLENLFGTIRGNCGANYNPTTGQFVAGLKTAILSNLAHLGSGNCAEDDCTTMTNYKQILSKSTATNICTESKMEYPVVSDMLCTESKTEDPVVSDMLSLIEDSFEESVSDSEELQACAYVCGFLLKHRKSTCKNCDSIFKAKDTGELVYTFVAFKEYNDIKKGLNYASQALIRCVESCATICNSFFLTSSHYLNLKQKTTIKLSEQVNFRFLMNCEEHYRMNIDFIINSVFYITVKRFCVLKNRQFSETHTNKALKRKLDILQHK